MLLCTATREGASLHEPGGAFCAAQFRVCGVRYSAPSCRPSTSLRRRWSCGAAVCCSSFARAHSELRSARTPSLLRQQRTATAVASASACVRRFGAPEREVKPLLTRFRNRVLGAMACRVLPTRAPPCAQLGSARAAPALRMRLRARSRSSRALPVAAQGSAANGAVVPSSGPAAAVAITGVAVYSAAPYVHDFLEGAWPACGCTPASRTALSSPLRAALPH